MVINGKLEYRKALILTPDRIRDLERIILKYCSNVTFEVETESESNIEFSLINELLEYDNYDKKRIKSLAIIGYESYNRIIACTFAVDYGTVCKCRYSVSSVDVETALTEEIMLLLKKSTASYWLSAWLRPFELICGGGITGWILAKDGGGIQPAFCAATLFFFMCYYINNYFLFSKIFPQLSFVWGEEVARFQKNEKYRTNLLWGIIITFFLGVAASVVASYITK